MLNKKNKNQEHDIDEKMIIEWQEKVNYHFSKMVDEIGDVKDNSNPRYTNVYKFSHTIREKSKQAKAEINNKFSTKPWKAKLVAVCIFALVFSIAIVIFNKDFSLKLVNFFNNIITRPYMALDNSLNLNQQNTIENENNQLKKSINKELLSNYILENKNKINNSTLEAGQDAIIIEEKELIVEVAGISEKAVEIE